MAIIRQKNPWGRPGGLEIQRADLWVLDLEPVREFIIQRNRAAGVSQSLPYDTRFYARQVQLPEDRMDTKVVMRGSNRYHMPDYDQPLGEIRVEFIHDAPAAVFPQEVMITTPPEEMPGSLIFRVIYAWREMARVARGERTSPSTDVVELDLAPMRINERGPLTYRFDIDCHLLRGSIEQFVAMENEEDRRELKTASLYRLHRAWCAGVQLGTLNYQGSELMTLSASLFAEAIVPITPTFP